MRMLCDLTDDAISLIVKRLYYVCC